ncbi:GNAT family N-acetyltransferase [Streptomyces lydicus]|uniref:GNAT family N-acetyltransferase n=1 Tax=Streptomyces lydicus TaxID=47763 RepID=UPI0036EE74F1
MHRAAGLGAMIGQILLRRATEHRRPAAAGKADLGYLCLPRAWGFGYAAEACAAALDWLRRTGSGQCGLQRRRGVP